MRRWYRNTGERKYVENWPYTADVTLQCWCGEKCLGLRHRIQHEDEGHHPEPTFEQKVTEIIERAKAAGIRGPYVLNVMRRTVHPNCRLFGLAD